eukprot:scaffold151888_cov31-Tisochrysis_lutea.AAC.4
MRASDIVARPLTLAARAISDPHARRGCGAADNPTYCYLCLALAALRGLLRSGPAATHSYYVPPCVVLCLPLLRSPPLVPGPLFPTFLFLFLCISR